MAGPTVAERGVTQSPEIKPLSEVSPEEIAKRTGGSLEWFRRKPFRIDYDNLRAVIHLWSIDEEEIPYLSINHHRGEEKHMLRETGVVLEEDSVAFVEPIRSQVNNTGRETIAWITISETEGITSYVKTKAPRGLYPKGVTSEILKAAEIAAESRKVKART